MCENCDAKYAWWYYYKDGSDNAGVIGEVSEEFETLTRRFDPSIKEDVR